MTIRKKKTHYKLKKTSLHKSRLSSMLQAISFLLHSAPSGDLTPSQKNRFLNLLSTIKALCSHSKSLQSFKNQPLPENVSRKSLINWINKVAGPVKVRSWGNMASKSKNKQAWGPVVWKFLHHSSAFFRKEHKPISVKLLNLVSQTLPCPECRGHFKKLLNKKSNKLHADKILSRRPWVNYVISLHAQVNKQSSQDGKKYLTYYPLPLSANSESAVLKVLKQRSFYAYSTPSLQISSPDNLNKHAGRVKTKFKYNWGRMSCGCGG